MGREALEYCDQQRLSHSIQELIMELRRKRYQFQLWHLLVAITLVGILVEPARWAYRCICTEETEQEPFVLTVVPRIIIQAEEESVQEIEIENLDLEPKLEQNQFQRSI